MSQRKKRNIQLLDHDMIQKARKTRGGGGPKVRKKTKIREDDKKSCAAGNLEKDICKSVFVTRRYRMVW